MTSETHRITNRTRGKLLSEGVHAVDATFEHLTVLRVLIEGLAENNEAGFWLTEVRGIPTVPRISPIDLIYVDREQRVVEAVELLPAGEQPPFREPAVSALVLPFQTISSTETRVGDQLMIDGRTAAAASAEQDKQTGATENKVPAAIWNTVSPVQQAVAPLTLPSVEPVTASVPPPPAPTLPHPTPASTLTVHEVVLPGEQETVPPQHVGAEPQQPRQAGQGKRNKKPHSRKARRQAAVAQRNKEAVVAARLRRKENQPVETPAVQAVAAPAVGTTVRTENLPLAAATPAPMKVAVPAAQAAPQPSAVLANPAKPKNGNEKGKVMAIVGRLLHWLNPNAIDEEKRSSIRRPASELVAYSGPEGEEKKYEVADISSSGIYLRTDERWELGQTVSLSLQRSGPVADSPDRHAEVDAGIVRHGKDGMGMVFHLPPGMGLDLWESAVSGQTAQTGPDYIVHEMRLAQALAVLRRICPQVVEEATRMLRKDFSSVRVRDSVRILLLTDKMLSEQPDYSELKAAPQVVQRILEMGSWASEDWTQKLWVGLLATACTPTGTDTSNAELIEILCQLALVHIRILEMACSRHAETAEGNIDSPTVTMRELTKMLDLSNLTKTLRSVGEMAELGLLTQIKRSASDPQDENAKTTVTPLGLRMFARCHGRRN